MIKNLTSNQVLLIAMATVLLLLAAFSFYLLQDPLAPMPFAAAGPTTTFTPLPASPTGTPAPSATSVPTRQTSYTPFASTPIIGTPPEVTATHQAVTPVPSGTTSPHPATGTGTVTSQPQGTVTQASSATPSTSTAVPTATETLSVGEVRVVGRLVLNANPIANAVVEFADDVAPRQAVTDSGGHYSFITLAPGTNFTLTFRQSDNPQIPSQSMIASLIRLQGTLPTGINPIELPDIDASIFLSQMLFTLIAPMDGATYSAAAIGPNNPIQFIWTLYPAGGIYRVELGPYNETVPIYSSSQLASSSLMWNGTLDNGNHITQGPYWWRVGVTRNLGNYVVLLYTQPWDILFNP